MRNAELGKIPPQVIEMEEAVLGSLMVEDCLYRVKVDLIPEMFYKEEHKYVFQAIINISNINKPIDMLTVTQELKRMNLLEDCGGLFFISQLTENTAGAHHIEEHAAYIVDMYARRKFIEFSHELSDAAFDSTVDTAELFNKLSDIKIGDIYRSHNKIKTLESSIKSAVEKIKEEVNIVRDGKSIGPTTPIRGLNEMTGGLRPWIIIIAGRPGMGKTQLALAFAKHQSKQGLNPAFFSLEMSNYSLSERLIVAEAGIDGDKMIQRKLDNYDLKNIDDAAKRLSEHNIFIDDDSNNSPGLILSKCKELKAKGKLDAVYIDYLQIVNMNDIQKGSRDETTGEAMRIFRIMAKELSIPVVVLSQLNREVEATSHKEPNMSHLRNSGSIEQDADLIIFPYRPSYYGILSDKSGEPYPINFVNMITGKFRHGQARNIPCIHNSTVTEFYDIRDRYNNESYDNHHGSNPYQGSGEKDAGLFSELDFGS